MLRVTAGYTALMIAIALITPAMVSSIVVIALSMANLRTLDPYRRPTTGERWFGRRPLTCDPVWTR